ncbi:hypothetical protein CCR95_00165 [Thiocystis minor]|nr:hypothetical protein [Thiocystis minor]
MATDHFYRPDRFERNSIQRLLAADENLVRAVRLGLARIQTRTQDAANRLARLTAKYGEG